MSIINLEANDKAVSFSEKEAKKQILSKIEFDLDDELNIWPSKDSEKDEELLVQSSNIQNRQIRKVGERKTDLSSESDSEVLKKAKSLIRTDFGGSSDPCEVIRKKMKEEYGVDAGPKSCAAIKKMH